MRTNVCANKQFTFRMDFEFQSCLLQDLWSLWWCLDKLPCPKCAVLRLTRTDRPVLHLNSAKTTNHACIPHFRREQCSSRNQTPLICPQLQSNSMQTKAFTFATALHFDSQWFIFILFQIDNELFLRLDVSNASTSPPFPISLFLFQK